MWKISAPLWPPVRWSINVHRFLLGDLTVVYFISALLIFEWALTFTREVDRVWQKKFTGATVVYTFTRDSNLWNYVVSTAVALPRTSNDNIRFLKYTYYAKLLILTCQLERGTSPLWALLWHRNVQFGVSNECCITTAVCPLVISTIPWVQSPLYLLQVCPLKSWYIPDLTSITQHSPHCGCMEYATSCGPPSWLLDCGLARFFVLIVGCVQHIQSRSCF